MSENEVETCLCPNSSTQLPSRYLYAPIEISSAMSLFHFETASGHGNSRGYHIGIIHTTWKFPVFGVIQSECGKIRISITLNTDTFYAVTDIKFLIVCGKWWMVFMRKLHPFSGFQTSNSVTVSKYGSWVWGLLKMGCCVQTDILIGFSSCFVLHIEVAIWGNRLPCCKKLLKGLRCSILSSLRITILP